MASSIQLWVHMWTQGLFISMYDKIHYKLKKRKKEKKKKASSSDTALKEPILTQVVALLSYV